jgi:hypothetical protein
MVLKYHTLQILRVLLQREGRACTFLPKKPLLGLIVNTATRRYVCILSGYFGFFSENVNPQRYIMQNKRAVTAL